MHLTGGKDKGRILNSPQGLEARPTASKVRQAIFNIYQQKIADCRFLDLYAGSGIMGMEALSRGAKEVVYVDQSRKMVKLIQENLNKLGYEAETICDQVLSALPQLASSQFDIIYIDPPYSQSPSIQILKSIAEYSLLNAHGVIIFEHLRDNQTEDKIANFQKCTQRNYGQTSLSIYE